MYNQIHTSPTSYNSGRDQVDPERLQQVGQEIDHYYMERAAVYSMEGQGSLSAIANFAARHPVNESSWINDWHVISAFVKPMPHQAPIVRVSVGRLLSLLKHYKWYKDAVHPTMNDSNVLRVFDLVKEVSGLTVFFGSDAIEHLHHEVQSEVDYLEYVQELNAYTTYNTFFDSEQIRLVDMSWHDQLRADLRVTRNTYFGCDRQDLTNADEIADIFG
jgi:hypothetical protein